ncbi:MAG: hypothetical protein U9R08_02800 [Nanoarchaeota archaeon]|nr:hypothetical protein [Nanoarchaeota archaeon]
MKTVKYNSDTFQLTEEEYERALIVWATGKPIRIKRLGCSLSPYWSWAGNPPGERYSHDGRKLIKKFGQLVFAECPDRTIDYKYYPEVAKGGITKEEYEQKRLNK